MDIRVALSSHDMTTPATPEELRTLAAEMEEVLIRTEGRFDHPDWRLIDGLRALATVLEAKCRS